MDLKIQILKKSAAFRGVQRKLKLLSAPKYIQMRFVNAANLKYVVFVPVPFIPFKIVFLDYRLSKM